MKVLDYFRKKSIYPNADCGGAGICGKCKFICKSVEFPVSEADEKLLSKEELKQGIRLACKSEIDDDVASTISLNEFVPLWITEESIDSKSGLESESMVEMPYSDDKSDVVYGIAIDMGTTTIAVCIVSINMKAVIDECVVVNRGRSFGADVISRIDAANMGGAAWLKETLLADINTAMDKLLLKNKIAISKIRSIVIAGNTTMEHLLLGLDTNGLGKYPFVPDSVEMYKGNGRDVFVRDDLANIDVFVLPGISAFIGADIVAGIDYLGIINSKKPVLFVDLGTNGEMILGCGDKILATSTAAGPAFEGVNISCGVASIPGAIDIVKINKNTLRADYSTIKNQTPIGICGSGVIAVVSELLCYGILDENGTLSDVYFEKGYPIVGNICITQGDIREFQKAKSAIRSGIEVLIKEYGIESCDIDKVYIAGGFGAGLNIVNAKKVGLLPELSCDVEIVGNTSLKGAISFLLHQNNEKYENIKSGINEIVLANNELFERIFIDNMLF